MQRDLESWSGGRDNYLNCRGALPAVLLLQAPRIEL